MHLHYFKTLLIYGGLWFLGGFIVSFFSHLFGATDPTLIFVVLTLIFAYFAGFYGVKSLAKIPGSEKIFKSNFGSPFWTGLCIIFTGHILAVIILYFLDPSISAGAVPTLQLIVGGVGGHKASKK